MITLFALLALTFSIGINAQELQEVYRNDKILIKEYESANYCNLLFIEDYDNYDNDKALFRVLTSGISSIYYVDKNLNLTNLVNIPNNMHPFLKLNNKIYGYSYNSDTNTNTYDFNMSVLDISTNNISSYLINKGIKNPYGNEFQKVIMLKNKELLFAFYTPSASSLNLYLDTIKLIKVDTNGNILVTKKFNDSIMKIDIGYIDNQILYSMYKLTSYENKKEIYFLNEETLEKEDSINTYNTFDLTAINDSIFTFFGDRGYLFYRNCAVPTNDFYIGNKNTKLIYSIISITNYAYDNVFMEWSSLMDESPVWNKIDFVNQDSIYSMFYLRKFNNQEDYYVGLGIINYKLSGDTNFVYKLLVNDSAITSILVYEIKATNDGGLLLNLKYNSKPCLAKFMPNGLVSILDIETKEKETINVYPNPAKDYINIDIEATNFNKGEIELFDMQGKLVKKDRLKGKQGNRIDVSNLNAGAYTYNVSLNGKTISGKVIIGK